MNQSPLYALFTSVRPKLCSSSVWRRVFSHFEMFTASTIFRREKISHLNWYCCTYKNCIKSASGSPVHVKNGGHSNGEAGGFNYHFCKWNISKTLQNFRCSNVFGFFECFVWIFTSTAKDVSCWELCTTLHKTGERKNWTKKFYRDKSNSGQFSQNEKTRTLLINSRERGYGNCHSAKAILSLILCFDDIIPQKVQLMIH